MRDKAVEAGLESRYDSNENYRKIFDQMHRAVEALPDSLRERGRELWFPQLHRACVEGDDEMVAALLHAGLSPDCYPCTEDEDDETPLVWLAQQEDMDIAAKVRIANLLIAAGADVEKGDPADVALNEGDGAFHQFLLSGRLKVGGNLGL